MRSTRLFVSVTVVAGLLAGVGAGASSAETQPTRSDQSPPPATVGITISDEDARRAVEYWTPERMAAAVPAPVPPSRTLPTPVDTVDSGEPRVIAEPGSHSASDVLSAPDSGGELPPQPDVPDPEFGDQKPGPKPPTPPLTTEKTVGRIFAIVKGTSLKFHCSGAAVNSPNRSLVWTAGHCLSPGGGYSWYDNVVFVPGYGLDGPESKTLGVFPALRMESFSAFALEGNFHHDIGAMVVGRSDGAHLLTRTGGGHGLITNLPRDRHYEAYGYPEVTKDEQFSCKGGLAKLGVFSEKGWGLPSMMELACPELTKGSSGGPWLVNMQCLATCPVDGFGWIASVVSISGNEAGQFKQWSVFGPYQHELAATLFHLLAKVPV